MDQNDCRTCKFYIYPIDGCSKTTKLPTANSACEFYVEATKEDFKNYVYSKHKIKLILQDEEMQRLIQKIVKGGQG